MLEMTNCKREFLGLVLLWQGYRQLRLGFVVSNEIQDQRKSTIISLISLGPISCLASGYVIEFSLIDVLPGTPIWLK